MTEWNSKALDRSEGVYEPHEFIAELSKTGLPTIEREPTTINYNPSENSVKPFDLTFSPEDVFKNNDYIGGTCVLYVDGKHLVEGQIKTSEVNEDERSDFNITVHPEPMELGDSVVNGTIQDSITHDVVAKLIDGYNEVVTSKSDISDMSTTDFSLEPGDVLESQANGATATISGINVDNLTLYVKYFGETNEDLQVDIGTFTQVLEGGGIESKYGTWVTIEPEGVSGTQDITFTGDVGVQLYDWVGINDIRFKREVDIPNADVIGNPSIIGYGFAELKEHISDMNNVTIDDDNNVIRATQQNVWVIHDSYDSIGTVQRDFADATNGKASLIDANGDRIIHALNEGISDDAIEDGRIFVRGKKAPRAYGDGENGYTDFSGGTISTTHSVRNGNSITDNFTIDISNEEEFMHTHPESSDVVFESKMYAEQGSSTYTITGYQPQEDNPDLNVTIDVILDFDNNEITISGTHPDLDGSSSTDAFTLPTNQWSDLRVEYPSTGVVAVIVDGVTASEHTIPGDERAEMVDGFSVSGADVYHDVLALFDDEYGCEIGILNNQEEEKYTDSDFPYDEFAWREMELGDEFEEQTAFQFEYFHMNPFNKGYNNLWLDCAVVVGDDEIELADFDNTITNGHLDTPGLYSNAWFELEVEVTDYNISTASTSINLSNVADPTSINDSDWGPTHRISDTEYEDYPDGVTIDTEFTYPGRMYKVRVNIPIYGERDSTSPRTKYISGEVDSIDGSAQLIATPVLSSFNIDDNRLGAISSICSKTQVQYRFEGNVAEIFTEGERKTTPNLNTINVSSGKSIENAYKSVQVIGRYNVKSNVIVSDAAPSYLNNHKEIRNPELETESDCNEFALSFIRDNGEIEYYGTIKTLPTLAPVGEDIDGSLFNHGKDMTIRTVSYSSRRVTIELGRVRRMSDEVQFLSDGNKERATRESGKGLLIPSGEDEFRDESSGIL